MCGGKYAPIRVAERPLTVAGTKGGAEVGGLGWVNSYFPALQRIAWHRQRPRIALHSGK